MFFARIYTEHGTAELLTALAPIMPQPALLSVPLSHAEEQRMYDGDQQLDSASVVDMPSAFLPAAEYAYDPTFVFPLMRSFLAECTVDCRKFIEMGMLAYTVNGLANANPEQRQQASFVIAGYAAALEQHAQMFAAVQDNVAATGAWAKVAKSSTANGEDSKQVKRKSVRV